MKLPSRRERAQYWSAGDYGYVADHLRSASEHLLARLAPSDGDVALDIACGSGNAALLARMAGASVVGCDITPKMLRMAKERATALGATDITWDESDCLKLPYENGRFDLAFSVFGMIFAGDNEKAASEMMRVLRPGGRFGLTTWPRDEMSVLIEEGMQKTIGIQGRGRDAMEAWADEGNVRRLFGPRMGDLTVERGEVVWPTPSIAEWWDRLNEKGAGFIALRGMFPDDATYKEFSGHIIEGMEPHFDGTAVRQGYILYHGTKRS